MALGIVLNYFKEAGRTMKDQRLRTAITILIIAIGILSLVGTLTVVRALNHTFTGNLKTLGANTFTISRYENSVFTGRRHGKFFRKQVNPRITWFEANTFKRKFDFPGSLVSVSVTPTNSAELSRGEKKTNSLVSVTGADEHYLDVYHNELQSGRNFTKREISGAAPVTIIGDAVRKSLFDRSDPLGKEIVLRGYKLRVIGTVRPKGSTFGGNQDNFVIIPLTLARKIYAGRRNIPYTIRVLVKDPDRYEQAKSRARMLMRSLRRLRPGQADNFGIRGSEADLRELKKMDRILRIAAFVIGLITIFASSVALMNIMLVTVTERIREIGIRKAVGASAQSVRIQFFIETLAIALSGAIVGILGGILFGFAIAKLLHIAFAMPWNAVFWAVILTFITAFVSGFYPAVKAARANPVEALHYE